VPEETRSRTVMLDQFVQHAGAVRQTRARRGSIRRPQFAPVKSGCAARANSGSSMRATPDPREDGYFSSCPLAQTAIGQGSRGGRGRGIGVALVRESALA